MKQQEPQKILLTFARSFITLEIARHLHAQGHTIYAADSLPVSITRFSNTIAKHYETPSPRFEPEMYVKRLVEIVKEQKIDLLIPIYEEISYIAKAADIFPKSCKIFCPSFDLFDMLQNKWRFQTQLKSWGIPTVDVTLITTQSDLMNFHCEGGYALKPCYSRASLMMRKITQGQQIPDIPISSYNPWIAQKWIEGTKFCTYSVCHQGQVCAHSTYPVSYAIDGNSCIIFSSVRHQEIYKWVSSFVQKLNFTGQIAFDFIETENQELFAIECNPRSTNGILLFSLEDRIDRALLGTNETVIFPKEGASRQIAMGMLLYGWRKSARRGRSLGDFIKSLFATKDVIFSLNDLKPFLCEPMVFAYLWRQCQKTGLPLPAFFTYDHDWNGESLDILATR